jgi:hypothetical protein
MPMRAFVASCVLAFVVAGGEAMARPDAQGGICFRVRPVCGAGLRAVCLCPDRWLTHCAWSCVASAAP